MEKLEKRIDSLIAEKEAEKESSDVVGFLMSLRDGLAQLGSLTEKQVRALEKIEKLSTPEAKKEIAEWKSEYPKRRKEAIVCAKYYLANPPYFEDLASRIISDPRFIPTKSQFEALCNNKFTKKVLKEYHREPVYEKGALVQVRDSKTVPWHLAKLSQKLCVVIDNKHDLIPSHAEGSKVYKLLPFGKQQTMLCQERWIKPFRKSTKSS